MKLRTLQQALTNTISKYACTISGAIFSMLSFSLVFTIFVPIISLFPAVFILSALDLFIDEQNVLIKYIITSLILVAVSGILIYRIITYIKRNPDIANRLLGVEVITMMILLFFVIHPLGILLFSCIKYGVEAKNFSLDNFYAIYIFSSFVFLPFGFILDKVKNKSLLKKN